MKIFLAIGTSLGVLSLLYSAWSNEGRVTMGPATTHSEIKDVTEQGEDRGKGNLLGIQPYMQPWDYASESAFKAKLSGYLDEAKSRGFMNEQTVVVLPEYIGTWLVSAGEKPDVYDAPTVDEAMRSMIVSNLFSFTRSLVTAEGRDAALAALFVMKAPTTARSYHRVMRELALTYGVTLVGGSLVLPEPRLENGELMTGDGPLYNVSVVYGPDGVPFPQLVKKVFPTADELPFTTGARVEELAVFDTKAGRLGVLICADSWYPSTYSKLSKLGVDLLAVPSFLSSSMERRWPGYNGAEAPEDVDQSDYGRITEGEAWLKYALAGRMGSTPARAGINVFLRGRLWDLEGDGRPVAVAGQEVHQGRADEGPAILNLWL